ncbi:hypothetical protein C8R47DRAFT_1326983 [Mycena vitilis]|nr:hypothetical protein C8R47DRAFT_1326983 [Mycena vitilis]
MRLFDTPYFQSICWRTDIMANGSWIKLDPHALGPEYACFLAALKKLDAVAVPKPKAYDMDGSEFRAALGLQDLASDIPKSTTYSLARGQVWACLLHFQVLDLILATDFPSLCKPSSIESIPPTFRNINAVLGVLEPLSKWVLHLNSLKAQLNGPDTLSTSATAAATPDGQPLPSSGTANGQEAASGTPDSPTKKGTVIESLQALVAYSEIEGITLKSKTFKNLQAMATAIIWILELGAEHAPVLTLGNQIAINPKEPVGQRFKSLPFDAAKFKKKKMTASQFFRPLSYALNISPVLLFCDMDLTTTHLDMRIEHEISHCLIAAGHKSEALAYFEQAILVLGRHTLANEQAMGANFYRIMQDMPIQTERDTGIFSEIIQWFSDHRANIVSNRLSQGAATTQSRVFHFPRFETIRPQMEFAVPVGPITRALSRAPSTPPVGARNGPPRPLSPHAGSKAVSTAAAQALVSAAIGPEVPVAPELGDSNAPVVSESTGSNVPAVAESQIPPFDGSNVLAAAESQIPPFDGSNVLAAAESQIPPVDDPTVGPPSPLSPAPSDHSMDVDSKPASPSPSTGKEATRRSTRVKAAVQVPDSQPTEPAVTRTTKRKASKTASEAAAKKAKLEVAKEDEHSDEEDEEGSSQEDDTTPTPVFGLDKEWKDPFDAKRWINDLAGTEPLERSAVGQTVSALLPDGITQRTFEYVGHSASEHSEYKLIFDVTTSMANVRRRCSQDGALFREYKTEDLVYPAVNAPHLRWMDVSQWNSMSDTERVKLWGTGVDLFIFDMRAGPKTEDIRSQAAKNYRMDAPLEVQVQGLRVPPPTDSSTKADYTKSIRTTTLRTVLEHAEKPDGLVLNALKLPSGYVVHANPLLGSGFDLEAVAYRLTNGLDGFPEKEPPYKEMYWELLGLAHALSLFHFDISATWVYVSGPGEKFWIRARPRTTDDGRVHPKSRDISNVTAFDNWEPDEASLESCDYEVVALPAGAGVLLQQPGREHAVISTNTGDGGSEQSRTATWTVGGYFFCASSIRPAICISLHMVMLQHVLTNSDHTAMWPIFIRVAMFWLTVTADLPSEDAKALAAYCPNRSPQGWMDIIYLACVVILFPCLDLRPYGPHGGEATPADELAEASAVCDKYVEWRIWLASKYIVSDSTGPLEWESGIFSPCLLHLALTLRQYHQKECTQNPDLEIFQRFTVLELTSNLSIALRRYDTKLGTQFNSKIKSKSKPQAGSERCTNFFLFEGKELVLTPL